MSDLDPVLAHAKRDANGNVAIGYLRREDEATEKEADEDGWDALIVAEDRQPLTFWSNSNKDMSDEAATDEEGNVLHVVVSTPAGVRPAGLIAMPAKPNGSPVGTLEVVVTGKGYTDIRSQRKQHTEPPPEEGPWHIGSLLDTVAAQTGDEYQVAGLEAADGGVTPVLLDWDGRPIFFWVDVPQDHPEPPKRELAALAASKIGFVAMVVDEMLRPEHSEEWMAQHLRDE